MEEIKSRYLRSYNEGVNGTYDNGIPHTCWDRFARNPRHHPIHRLISYTASFV